MQRSALPVIVVGNGPVGQSAALLLARWRLPVVLLDERPAREPAGSRAVCQQRDVLDIWDAVGAGAQIAAEGVTWRTVRTFYKDRPLFAYDLADRGRSVFPPFVNISQSRTEQILDARIARTPLVDVRWGHHVASLEPSADSVTVRCETEYGPVSLTGGFALVCAGARADALRRQVGVSFDGTSFDDRFLICDIEADLPGWVNERRFYFDPIWNPGRQVLIHPCPGGTFRIDWQVPSDFDLDAEAGSGALDARVRAIVGDRPYRVVWKSVYRFHSRVVDRMRAGRVLLAGDSAHLYAPFGARGLNSGVQDAENAAWKIACVLSGVAGDALLDSYDRERRAAALENLDITTRTMNFLLPRTEAQHRRRVDLLERAIADPSAWPDVDSGRLAEPFWYVDSPLTTIDASRPFAGRPPRGEVPPPAPGVIVPDVPVAVTGATRFRQLCREGPLLLAGAGVDVGALERTVRAAYDGGVSVRVVAQGSASPDGSLAGALQSRRGEAWLVRPDAHVAAVVSAADDDAVVRAIDRMLARGGS
jgi:pentachlorophenol monooxygenase/3-(3-hydroxy-phenyl)propionate hydroxylase